MTWKTPRTFLTAAVVLLFCAPARAGAHDPATDIVARIVAAYGGAERVGRVSTVKATGTIDEFLSGRRGEYARYYRRPGRLRIEVLPEAGGEVRILNGRSGWQGEAGGGMVPARAILRQSMLYQYTYLDLPMGLVHGDYSVTYRGKVRQNGRERELLDVAGSEGPVVHVQVDPHSFLITRVSADFAMGMMGSGELATEYSDYRETAGVPFPRRLANFAGSTPISEIDISYLQVNIRLAGSLFLP